MSIYDHQVETLAGETVSMKQYEGDVLLIVNTASKCGFTPQFAGLETLWKEYADKGLVVVGFPSNQFGGQDPGSNDQIASFCQLNYGVSFPMMSKVEVNGAHAHPLWKWLTAQAPGILGVGASRSDDTLATFSTYGAWVRVMAPGDHIMSTIPGGGYASWSGTSMSAPLAAKAAQYSGLLQRVRLFSVLLTTQSSKKGISLLMWVISAWARVGPMIWAG